MGEIPAGLVWNAITTLAIGPLAWFLRSSLAKLDDVETMLRQTRESLLREYATKADVHHDITRVLDRFDRLEVKIDNLLTSRATTK